MEELLLKAIKGEDTSTEMCFLQSHYSSDINIIELKNQLPVLRSLLSSEEYTCFDQVYSHIQNLNPAKRDLISQFLIVVKLLLVSPATNAVGERSFSTARRLKTWLRSSMNQMRFNNLAILNVHKERLDEVDLVDVANEFVAKSDHRKKVLGVFSEEDFKVIK